MKARSIYALTAAFTAAITAAYPLKAQTLAEAVSAHVTETAPANDQLAYMVVRQPLVQFIQQLERDTGRQINISDGVDGMLSGVWLEGDLPTIIASLADRQGLHWFTFNNVIYLSDAAESRMRLIRLGDIPSASARAALSEAGLLTDRFALTDAAQGTALAMSGPPKLLGLSEAVIETLTVAPALIDDNRIVIRRALGVSLEPMRASDITARYAAEQAAARAEQEAARASGDTSGQPSSPVEEKE